MKRNDTLSQKSRCPATEPQKPLNFWQKHRFLFFLYEAPRILGGGVISCSRIATNKQNCNTLQGVLKIPSVGQAKSQEFGDLPPNIRHALSKNLKCFLGENLNM